MSFRVGKTPPLFMKCLTCVRTVFFTRLSKALLADVPLARMCLKALVYFEFCSEAVMARMDPFTALPLGDFLLLLVPKSSAFRDVPFTGETAGDRRALFSC